MRGKASFIKPMAIGRLQTSGRVYLRSRNDNDFGGRYAGVPRGLKGLPPETVIDGEIVALDESGRPSLNRLQNYVPGSAPTVLFVFDVTMLRGCDVTGETLTARRELVAGPS
jgi:ATP-dependent DNA ligase